jgi:diaminopimelate decarboxylase
MEINEPSYQFAEPAIEELMDIVGRTDLEDCYSDITFEYGRYIAAPCGKYFTGVVDVKRTGKTDYAILEGGLHQITYFGSMAGMKVPYINYISDTSKKESRDYVLAGSLCSVNDILVRKVNLPRLDIGDTLCFNLAGAYCATEGISLFLSRDLPAIVVTEESGNEMLLREHIETNYLNGGYNG